MPILTQAFAGKRVAALFRVVSAAPGKIVTTISPYKQQLLSVTQEVRWQGINGKPGFTQAELST